MCGILISGQITSEKINNTLLIHNRRECPENGMIPFIGIEIIRTELRLRFKSTERQQTLVYSRILRVILTNDTKSVLQDAYALSSVTEAFNVECDKLRPIFSRLNYPRGYIESVISKSSL